MQNTLRLLLQNTFRLILQNSEVAIAKHYVDFAIAKHIEIATAKL